MRKFLFLLMLISVSSVVLAYDFSAVAPNGQTLYYTISGSSAVVTSQNAEAPYYDTYPTGVLDIPATVAYNGDEYVVDSIGSYAFYGCSGLTKVSIPNSVSGIGEYAFFGCNGMSSVSIGVGLTLLGTRAFQDCAGVDTLYYNARNLAGSEDWSSARNQSDGFRPMQLRVLVIGDDVETIPENAFYRNSYLSSVYVGRFVYSISSSAFLGCNAIFTVYNLSDLTITKGTLECGGVAYNAKRVIEPEVYGEGKNAVYQISELYSTVGLEDGVEYHIPVATIPNNYIYSNDGGASWVAKRVVLSDCQDAFFAPVAFTAANATYTREFANGNRSTLYLPFTAAVPSGFEVYKYAGFDGNTLSFVPVSTPVIDAYTPYMVGYDLAKSGTTTCEIDKENAEFPATVGGAHPITYSNMTFQGVLDRTQMSSSSNYGYKDGYFVRSGGSAHVNPFRCYFTWSSSPQGAPAILSVEFAEGGTLGIAEAGLPARCHAYYSTDVYDLQGRLVRKNADNLNGLPKGVYIWKGKKTVVF